MDLSTNCTQFIENSCTSSALTKFASWTDRKGTKNYFWHGDRNSTDEGCQCSLEGECVSYGLFKTLCNCDGFGTNVVDSGEITSMDKLPIAKLNYGTSIPNGKINYYLGPMICSGKQGTFPSEQDDADKQLVQEKIKSVTEELRTAKKEIYSATRKLKSEVQEQIQNVANDLENSKRDTSSITTNLQSQIRQQQQTETKNFQNLSRDLQHAKKDITSLTTNLQSKVKEQIQTVAQDLGNTKKDIQLIRTNLQSRVDELQVNYNQTLQQLVNVTSTNQSLTRQKRDLENNLYEVSHRLYEKFGSLKVKL